MIEIFAQNTFLKEQISLLYFLSLSFTHSSYERCLIRNKGSRVTVSYQA